MAGAGPSLWRMLAWQLGTVMVMVPVVITILGGTILTLGFFKVDADLTAMASAALAGVLLHVVPYCVVVRLTVQRLGVRTRANLPDLVSRKKPI